MTNLISSYGKMTCLVDKEKAVDDVYSDFSKTFDNVSFIIPLEKMVPMAWMDALK